MPQLIAYGEDALTLAAITSRLSDLLHELGDTTNLDEALSIYRPSFGRRGGSLGNDGTDGKAVKNPTHSSEFGEFDAIVATAQAIYLIEAKWSGSGEVKNGSADLRDEQTHRHEVFGWYLRNWKSVYSTDWESFCTSNSETFPSGKHNTCLPKSAESKLTRNLIYLLGRLSPISRNVVNVLLYHHLPSEQILATLKNNPPDNGFTCVNLVYHTIGSGGFIRIP